MHRRVPHVSRSSKRGISLSFPARVSSHGDLQLIGQPQQGHQAFPNGLHNCRWSGVGIFSVAGAPVNALNRIGQNDSGGLYLPWELDLERIAFYLIGNRNHPCESGLSVVYFGRQNQSRAPTTLLVPLPRTQIYFDDVPSVGNVGGSYHISLPAGLPQSCSSYRFSGVMPATSDSSVSIWFNGSMVMQPSPRPGSRAPLRPPACALALVPS